MTWKKLKERIDSLSPEQLKGKVLFQDNHDNLMPVKFCMNDDKPYGEPYPIVNEEWKTKVGVNMPFLGL